jgi:hypothetical protein
MALNYTKNAKFSLRTVLRIKIRCEVKLTQTTVAVQKNSHSTFLFLFLFVSSGGKNSCYEVTPLRN